MAQLLDLPNEMLTEILSNLVGLSGTLAKLCLICSRFRDIAQPLLFQDVSIRPKIKAGPRFGTRLLSFISVVLSKPTLARRVERLKIIDQDTNYLYWDEIEHSYAEKHQLRLISGCVDQILGDEINRYIRMLRRRYSDPDRQICLLLMLLPNLKMLNIRISYYSTSNRMSGVVMAEPFALDTTDRTRVASFVKDNNAFQAVTKLITTIEHLKILNLGLKNLKSLELDCLDYWKSDSLAQIPNSTVLYPKLDCVSLQVSWKIVTRYRSCELVQKLFESFGCNEVRALDIMLAHGPSKSFFWTYSLLGTFNNFLIQTWGFKNGLKKLSLDFWAEGRGRLPDAFEASRALKMFGPVSTLSFLRALKTLNILQQALIPQGYGKGSSRPLSVASSLPPAVEHLTIICPNNHIITFLKAIQDKPHWMLPHLEKITLSCRWMWGKQKSWFENHISSSLKEALKAMSIDLEIVQDLAKPPRIDENTLDIFESDITFGAVMADLFDDWELETCFSIGQGEDLFSTDHL